MTKGADFDPRMLRLATQKARERKLRTTLLAALAAILRTIRGGAGRRAVDMGVEALTLVRSLVRLSKELLAQPGSNRCEELEVLRSVKC